MRSARVIAFHLPQFHPIPENNEWWGPGFTEWTNTAKARPLYRGHYQPHVPADLGFYDLRLPESRAAQSVLAAQYGIEAFCYYHYWFAGRELLQRPVDEIVASGEPDFPFCLCWANQTWQGVWHDAAGRVLIEQTYPGQEDHRAHFERLLPAFADRRYVRVDGRPLYVVAFPLELKDSKRALDQWRQMAVAAGLGGLFLVAVTRDPQWDYRAFGYDAATIARLPPKRREWISWASPLAKVASKVNAWRGRPMVYDYAKIINWILTDPVAGFEHYPCVIPNWDNTARCGANGLVFQGSTPELFRGHLRRAIRQVQSLPSDRRLVFLKSWNEWAEGNHLEPDLRFGHRYLEAVRTEVTSA